MPICEHCGYDGGDLEEQVAALRNDLSEAREEAHDATDKLRVAREALEEIEGASRAAQRALRR